MIQPLDGTASLKLPTLTECDQIPNIPDEIATPEVAMHYPHLQDIVDHIPSIDTEADITMLIGRLIGCTPCARSNNWSPEFAVRAEAEPRLGDKLNKTHVF